MGLSLLIVFSLGLGLVWILLSNPGVQYSCTRLGHRALEARIDFVIKQVPSAADVVVKDYDCDSGSAAFVSFTATGGPAAVADAFLADPSCHADVAEEDEPGLRAISCDVGWSRVNVYLEPSGAATSGTLWID